MKQAQGDLEPRPGQRAGPRRRLGAPRRSPPGTRRHLGQGGRRVPGGLRRGAPSRRRGPARCPVRKSRSPCACFIHSVALLLGHRQVGGRRAGAAARQLGPATSLRPRHRIGRDRTVEWLRCRPARSARSSVWRGYAACETTASAFCACQAPLATGQATKATTAPPTPEGRADPAHCVHNGPVFPR